MITLYGSQHCAPCKVIFEKMVKKGMSFHYVDVDTKVGHDKAIQYGIQGIPSIVVEDDNLYKIIPSHEINQFLKNNYD